MPFQLLADLEDSTRRWTLESGETTVGSGPENDIRLDHPTVSRRHARLTVTPDSVEVEDLESRNGTWIGSRRLARRTRVEPGSPLSLGGLEVRIESVGLSDLHPAIAFQHSELSVENTFGTAASTAGAAPLDRFVLDELPALAERLRDGAGQLDVAQAVGAALWRCLSLQSLAILRDGEGLLFSAGVEESEGRTVIEVGPVTIQISMASATVAEYYSPLLTSMATLVDLAGARPHGGAARRPAGPPRAEAKSVPLPDPQSVVPAVVDLYQRARQVARGDIGVLILGESGVGKEVLARFIHQVSGRSAGAFIDLNCAALPRDLLEMELFGIEKGVATGVEARPGKFELADGGTLFLDEIGDMASETQAKILRVLQEGAVSRIGGREPRQARVRVLSATHRDPSSMIDEGLFRLDLFHRIAGWTVTVPPLRRRIGDIPNLAAFFLERESRQLGMRLKGISAGAVELLCSYPWSGNVRELAQEMARAALFVNDGDLLTKAQLSDKVRRGRPTTGSSLEDRLRAFEREVIEEALAAVEGKVPEAAERLSVPVSTLYRRIKTLELGRGDTDHGETPPG